MRHIVAATLLVLAAGCAAQGLPIDDSTGGGGGSGAIADMSKPLGGTGAMCKTACDCQPGLACRQGVCGMSNIGKIFCCESSDCPAGSFCQSSNGGFAQCGSSGGGGGGGGGGGFGGGPGGGGGGGGGGFGGADLGLVCTQIFCSATVDVCKSFGCGPCSASGFCGPHQ